MCESKRNWPLKILLLSASHLSLFDDAIAFSDSKCSWFSSSNDSELGTLRYERVSDPKNITSKQVERITVPGIQRNLGYVYSSFFRWLRDYLARQHVTLLLRQPRRYGLKPANSIRKVIMYEHFPILLSISPRSYHQLQNCVTYTCWTSTYTDQLRERFTLFVGIWVSEFCSSRRDDSETAPKQHRDVLLLSCYSIGSSDNDQNWLSHSEEDLTFLRRLSILHHSLFVDSTSFAAPL